MKIILSSLNSKYIHSNLAIRYLAGYVEDIIKAQIHEYTINQNIDFIVSEIYKEKPDLIGFSTYIWNIEETLKICEILKIVLPDTKILLGGPEVSFDGVQVLNDLKYIDFIIYGEGEETFKELIETIMDKNQNYKNIKGLVYRQGASIFKNLERPLIRNLDIIPSPYTNIKSQFENKIVYYESSRGCPFNCEFCLSSTIHGVRYFGMERVKDDLDRLIKGKVGQVKFVDRTFNANKKHFMEIMKFIISKDPVDINFHFEVTAHLLDEDTLDFLKDIKEGLFQFEIGVQSTNEETIQAVARTTDFEQLKYTSKKIKSYMNIHQHLDLIAGLPYEGYNSFKKSFNDVYSIRPEKLQLGFLKLLKGSGLRIDEEKHGYKYLDSPPYEILENDYISYGEIIKLKSIENLVEKYYNEGFFTHSLEFIIKNYYQDSFSFYEDFSQYWDTKDYGKLSHSKNTLYEILMEYFIYKDHNDKYTFTELIKLDYVINNRNSRLPKGIDREYDLFVQKNLHGILKNEKLLSSYLYSYKDIPTKKLLKKVIVEDFNINIFEVLNNNYKVLDKREKTYILFDYIGGKLNKCIYHNITEIVKGLI